MKKNKVYKTERIEIRCTKAQKKILTKNAQKENTTISNYLLSRTIADLENVKVTRKWIADKIITINAVNEIYHLVIKYGDENLAMQVKEIMRQMEVNEVG